MITVAERTQDTFLPHGTHTYKQRLTITQRSTFAYTNLLQMELVSQRNGSDPADSDRPEVIESTTVTQQDGETVTTRTVHVRTVNKIGGVNIVEKFHKNQDGPPSPDEADIDFIKRNSSKRRSLNKEAYIRLHRNVNKRNSIEVLKGRYEVPEGNNKKSDYAKLLDKRKSTGDRLVDDKAVAPRDVIVKSTQNIEVLQSKLSPKLSRDTVESLKVKYSPSNFGYPNLDEVKLRQKPALPAKPKGIPPPKSPIRTSTVTTYKIPTPLELETIPGHEVILRSSSEDSVERIESFLSEFTMDPKREVKEKKRTSSFRKILTGGLFGKDKKKNEKKHSEDKSKNKKTENVVVADNVQNEQMFNRNSSQRHTVDNHLPKQPKKTSPNLGNQKQYVEQDTNNLNEMERRYAEMHINNFNKLKASFSNPESYNKHPNDTYQYLHENDNSAGTIDKYIDTSSSSNTLESVDRSTYQNALIAQAELKQIQEKEMRAKQKDNMLQIRQTESPQNNGSVINTPPRAKEIHQNVQLVKPKALIPINSERALPNPYHNGQDGSQNGSLKKASEKNLNIDEKDYATKIPVYNRQNDFNDVYEYNTSKIQQQHQEQGQYSPNLTKSSTSSSTQNSPSSPSFSPRSSPRSPTLEGSKLRLPSNREKVNLQPRIKSPIPQPKISTEKIIATELLKNKSESKKFDTAPSPTHQKLHISSVENIYEPKPVNARLVKQSPVQGIARIPFDNASIIDPFEAAKWHQKQRQLAISPTIPDTSQVVTDAMVHVDPEMKRNSLQYSSLPVTMRRANQDAVSMRQRPVTPVKRVPSTQSLQQSPQKHEIRQSVELYCWKEIQKMKERQDQELKYQLQYTPYGYVEDPIIQRRSRSVEPIQQRSTKRSTSLPREVKSNMNSRMFYREPIPENHPVTYKEDDLYAQKNSNFVRSSPQRRTISGTTTSPQKPLQTYEGYYGSSVEVPYRPIFNRGSLNPQTQQEIQNQLQKKVSFTGNRNPAQDPSWPTKNGYVQSPPQRRMDKMASMGDDEVFLKDSQIKQVNEQIQKQLVKDSQQYATRDSLVSLPRQQSLEEAFYGSRMAGAIQSNNLLKYVNKPQPEQIINEPAYITRQNKQNTTELTKQQQENLQNIYGTRQQPDIDPLYATQLYQARNQQQLVPIQDIKNNGLLMADPRYGSKQQLAVERYYMNNNLVNESPYGSRQIMTSSPITKVTKQITVTNKVCDIYGNIHDNGKKIPVPSPNSAQIQQTGVIYGQLQGNVVGRPPQYQSYNQILPPSNFVRGNRLTASANDMYKRYPNDTRQREVLYAENPYGQHGNNFNPNGPLPPTPNEQSKMQLLMMRRNNQNRAYPQISDTESDTSEVRKIMNRNYTGGFGEEMYRRSPLTTQEGAQCNIYRDCT
ncbi:hypothetical protein Trydic_g22487 [Trypoxylus dichotomus]